MTFWSFTSHSNSSTDQTLYQFYDLDTELDRYRITRGFTGAFAMGEAYQQGTLTLRDIFFKVLFDNMCYSCIAMVTNKLSCTSFVQSEETLKTFGLQQVDTPAQIAPKMKIKIEKCRGIFEVKKSNKSRQILEKLS